MEVLEKRVGELYNYRDDNRSSKDNACDTMLLPMRRALRGHLYKRQAFPIDRVLRIRAILLHRTMRCLVKQPTSLSISELNVLISKLHQDEEYT